MLSSVAFSEFRAQARELLRQEIPPERATFGGLQQSRSLELFPNKHWIGERERTSVPEIRIPKSALLWMNTLSLHRDAGKWMLLYRIVWRLQHGEARLLGNPADPDLLRAERMCRQVRRDIHKMHAFVRFKKILVEGAERYVAWHEPDHAILQAAFPFFVKRFGSMNFSILTPELSGHWDRQKTRFTPGVPEAPKLNDIVEDWWTTYYASIFNPARIKIRMMKQEMPVRYWKSMPETALIPQLLREAPERLKKMAAITRQSAEPPVSGSLSEVRESCQNCKACPISMNGCTAVFGEGRPHVSLMIVGEQPGDEEDRARRPFVGPAGKVLANIFETAGLAREEVYLTNAVKHFKFEQRGKHRLHKRPDGAEILACKPWLLKEIELVKPSVIVCLGKTAAQSLTGEVIAIEKQNGTRFTGPNGEILLVTYHPSAALRAPDEVKRAHIEQSIVQVVRAAKALAAQQNA